MKAPVLIEFDIKTDITTAEEIEINLIEYMNRFQDFFDDVKISNVTVDIMDLNDE